MPMRRENARSTVWERCAEGSGRRCRWPQKLFAQTPIRRETVLNPSVSAPFYGKPARPYAGGDPRTKSGMTWGVSAVNRRRGQGMVQGMVLSIEAHAP